MAKFLFVSFTGTMYALESGRVTVEDLDTGLFVFGCTREHALTPGAGGEYIESIVSTRPDLHQQLVTALTAAEAEGRVRWRGLVESVSFALVNEVLTGNGCAPLALSEDQLGCYWGYNYPAVEEASKELTVIFRG